VFVTGAHDPFAALGLEDDFGADEADETDESERCGRMLREMGCEIREERERGGKRDRRRERGPHEAGLILV